ncbi:MAG TPA: nucleoside 2-deoxyribosyltransferase [Pyrinomonadaceae bacterium]|nr:nucleoside 2-deoxyribosyltransferase [Pyrinomonadaceae bacterium]
MRLKPARATMNIYFAGSIRGGRAEQTRYCEIVEQLKQYGRVLTEHVSAAELSTQGERATDQEIHDRDLDWLRAADCLVAEVTTPSLGVGYEIGKATEWGKPVLCLFRVGSAHMLSAMIAGSSNVSVRAYEHTAELNEIFAAFFGGASG